MSFYSYKPPLCKVCKPGSWSISLELTMSNDEVSINDLINDINENSDFGDLKKLASKRVEALQETSQAASDRANRHASYEAIQDNVSSWAPVVAELNRQRQIVFGNEENPTFEGFKPIQTDLSNTIDSILKEEKLTRESQLNLEDGKMANLSEAEIKARVEQLAQLRKLQFYNEIKARRWKKIKSKAFRRLHKKELSDLPLEELAEVDPEAFQARLKQIEADRAKERITLRHKNTSQWVTRVLQRGLQAATKEVKDSYDHQLRLGEELTKKITLRGMNEDNSEEEEETIENPLVKEKGLKSLLDMKFMKEAEEKKDKEKEELKKLLSTGNSEEIASSGILTIKAAPVLVNKAEEPMKSDEPPKPKENKEIIKKVETETPKTSTPKSNPWLSKQKKKMTKFVSASFQQPTEQELKEITDHAEFAAKEGQESVLADVLGLEEEFKKEKEELAKKESEKGMASIDQLHVQGWGSWTGAGSTETEGAKRRREGLERERNLAIEQSLKERKDYGNDNVILSQTMDPAIERYALTEVPKFYHNAKQLQAQLSYPIGPEFNSVSGFQTLIKPEIVTVAGKPIEPIFMTKMRRRKEKIDKRKQNRKALEASKSQNKE